MAYCNIQDHLLGKRLNKGFYEKTRNNISDLIHNPLFKEWFGKGKVDVEGNPLIDELLSFTNEKGEKRTIFDFGKVGFSDEQEVFKYLKTVPGVYVYKGNLFINNTLKNHIGKFVAESVVKLIKVVNYYYPGLLSVYNYTRSQTSPYTKGDIPLYRINIQKETNFLKSGQVFSVYEGATIENNNGKYNKLTSVDELAELQHNLDEFKQYGISKNDIVVVASANEVSQATYDRLKEFFLKLDPNAKISEVDNLSAEGIAYIRDFFIEVNSEGRFRAMPEEVSHFFIEMLPKDHPLLKDITKNITSFAIYGTTLTTYRNNPEYLLPNGNVDYEKIKKEAAGKLLAEYIYALSEDDFERIKVLTKTNDNFLKRWWDALLNWLRDKLNLEKKERFANYIKAAQDILNQEVEYLSRENIAKNINNGIYFRMSDQNKNEVAMAEEIILKTTKTGNLAKLENIVTGFRTRLGKTVNEILKQKGFESLREALAVTDAGITTDGDVKLNALGNLHAVLKTIDEEGLMNSESNVYNLSKFIHVIQHMEDIAAIYDTLIDTYSADGDVMSISELQLFRSTYQNLESLITNDLAKLLAGSDVGFATMTSLSNTVSAFATLENKILGKFKGMFKKMFKDIVGPQNKKILDIMSTDIRNTLIYVMPDKKDVINGAVDKYVKALQDDKVGIGEARTLLRTELRALGVSERRLKGTILNDRLDSVEKLYTTDGAVNVFMEGLGKDIDLMSYTSHLVTAAIKNHDILTADVARFIVDKRVQAQNLARVTANEYLTSVDPIVKELAKLGMNEYEIGEAITTIQLMYDASLNEKTGELVYKDKERGVVSLLHPTKEVANVEKAKLEALTYQALEKYKASKGTPEYDANKAAYHEARKVLNTFVNNYFNSPYSAEYRAYRAKWDSNPDYLDMRQKWSEATQKMNDMLQLYESDKSDRTYYHKFIHATRDRAALLHKEGKTEEELRQINAFNEAYEEGKDYREEDFLNTKRKYNLARDNFESKLDYAIGLFLKEETKKEQLNREDDKANFSPANLELYIQRTLKDPTIKLRSNYVFRAMNGDGKISDVEVRSSEEIGLVKELLLEDFLGRSIVKVKTDAYYEEQDRLFTDLELVKEKYGISPIDELISKRFKEITDLLRGKSDYYGQRNSETLLTEEVERIGQLEEAIKSLKDHNVKTYKISDEVKKKHPQYADAFKEYEDNIQYLYDSISGSVQFDAEKLDRAKKNIVQLSQELETNKLVSKEQMDVAAFMKAIYAELRSLSEKIPTQAYWDRMQDLSDILNFHLERMQNNLFNNKDVMTTADQSRLRKSINKLSTLLNGWEDGDGLNTGGLMEAIYGGKHELLDMILNDEYAVYDNQGGVTEILFSPYIDNTEGMDDIMAAKTEVFFEWFNINHKKDIAFVMDSDEQGEPKPRRVERNFVRRIFATHSDPILKESKDGKVLYEVKYHKRFATSKLKQNALREQVSWKETSNMEDWTVDNNFLKPNYLPLSKKQLIAEGKKDFKFVNEDYHKLYDGKDEKSRLLRRYLEISLNTYLKEQDNKPDQLKQMFHIPVTALDDYQSDIAYIKDTPDRLKRKKDQFIGWFKESDQTDIEDQLKGIDMAVDVNEQDQSLITWKQKIPRLGMNTKLDTNRVNRNVIAALQVYIIRSKDFDTRSNLNPIVKALLDVMKANEALGNTSQSKRTKIFDNIYKQMVLEEMPDNITNARFFRKAAGTIMSMSGFKLSADLVGGAINYIQANINNLVESFASKYVTPKSYFVGYGKSTLMIGDMLRDFSKKSDFNYWTMMYQAFEFIQGEWVDDTTDRSSIIGKRFDWRKVLMYPRKNGELHAQSAMAIAIMDNIKIENSIDKKMYPLWDIYEKKGDKLVVKAGFSEEDYNTTNGIKFQEVKRKIHGVNRDLHGNYDKFNQTEASRHSIGKMTEMMKRWFIPLLQRRVGRESFDVSTEDLSDGYYKMTVEMLLQLTKALMKRNTEDARSILHSYWTTPRKVENVKRMAADTIASVGLFFAIGLMGYDNDDPDRNKKLRDNSWLYNEALLIIIRSYAEQTSFIPVPPFGYTEMVRNLLDPFSVVKGTVSNAAGVLQLLMYNILYYAGVDSLHDDVFYTKDTGAGKGEMLPGASWMPSMKGDNKLKGYVLKTLGYSGSQVDPTKYIANFESMQNRLK